MASSDYFEDGYSEIIQCNSCGYVKTHPVHLGQNDEVGSEHYTCVCLLYDVASICCNKGYANLLNYIPSTAIYGPTPTLYTKNYMKVNEVGEVFMTSNEVEEIYNCCVIQDNVRSSYHYLRHTRYKISICNGNRVF